MDFGALMLCTCYVAMTAALAALAVEIRRG